MTSFFWVELLIVWLVGGMFCSAIVSAIQGENLNGWAMFRMLTGWIVFWPILLLGMLVKKLIVPWMK